MILIPEQVCLLRKKREELLESARSFRESRSAMERVGGEWLSAGYYHEPQDEAMNARNQRDLQEIEKCLKTAEYSSKRNFDMVDIGTRVYVDYDDGDGIDTVMLIDDGCPICGAGEYVSIGSSLGQAIIGKKVGDEVQYTVNDERNKTRRTLTAKVVGIDTVAKNYCRFIREKDYNYRTAMYIKTHRKEIRENSPEEMKRWYDLTPSQVELLNEELEKLSRTQRYSRIAHIKKILREHPVTVPNPEDDSIQIGSIVKIDAVTKDGEKKTLQFELIGRAVSTEIELDGYVERISALGNRIYGLRAGDTFTMKGDYAMAGTIASVENNKEYQFVR